MTHLAWRDTVGPTVKLAQELHPGAAGVGREPHLATAAQGRHRVAAPAARHGTPAEVTLWIR